MFGHVYWIAVVVGDDCIVKEPGGVAGTESSLDRGLEDGLEGTP